MTPFTPDVWEWDESVLDDDEAAADADADAEAEADAEAPLLIDTNRAAGLCK